MNDSTNNSSPLRQQLWYELQCLQRDVSRLRIENLFVDEPEHLRDSTIEASGLLLDYSKNLLNKEAKERLIQLAESCQLGEHIEALFCGKDVNNTEHRPALHTALRNEGLELTEEQRNALTTTMQRMEVLVEKLHGAKHLGYKNTPITDVVNIGIGGSDLGPVMASLALTPYAQGNIAVHFVSNIDSTHLVEKLKTLKPETTLFIVASKSFKTIETRKNAEAARHWYFQAGAPSSAIAKHFIAVSSNIHEAMAFGIDEHNIFPVWDWVGGRFSLWSAIGLPIAIEVGMENFKAMLEGGRRMDEHFRHTELKNNMPVMLALLSIWYINFFDCEAQLIVPYDHYLHKFPAFLQQLEMESNGKSVRRDGSSVDYHTMGALFGEAGSNTQHSFHQLLHQGTHLFPVDFIVALQSHNPISDQHTHLFANCLSQSRALMCGKSQQQVIEELVQQGLAVEEIDALAPHKVIAGNKPSNTIVMDKLTPHTLGALIALYEHKVYVQSVIWQLDAFDQWGVELGKSLSEDLFSALLANDKAKVFDQSTELLIERFKNPRNI